MDYSFRPIDRWPGTLTTARRGRPFHTSWGRTLELLDRELDYLHARNIVFQVAMQESDIRLDGRPRARAIDAYRQLARRLHPDAAGGSHDEFVKLQQARELIEA
jgi:hypothetical protein